MRKYWTEAEEQWLRDNYETLGLVKSSECLERTQSAILHKAVVLGIANRRGGNRRVRTYIYGGYECISTTKGRYFTHRKIMEDYLGRPLTGDEIVHHINGNKLDNRIENLELTTRSEHQKIFHRNDLELRRNKGNGQFTGSDKEVIR